MTYPAAIAVSFMGNTVVNFHKSPILLLGSRGTAFTGNSILNYNINHEFDQSHIDGSGIYIGDISAIASFSGNEIGSLGAAFGIVIAEPAGKNNSILQLGNSSF